MGLLEAFYKILPREHLILMLVNSIQLGLSAVKVLSPQLTGSYGVFSKSHDITMTTPLVPEKLLSKMIFRCST